MMTTKRRSRLAASVICLLLAFSTLLPAAGAMTVIDPYYYSGNCFLSQFS